ncbi:hypothetical protein KIH31_15545 [Paenarthrobacter sp. DKR-5]|uniref:hypothetical protein n=1 Tax=Paenarthrobacter sp. DKR-5 TaxID=2835535 RepID=UPI001BDD3867|nr:hypothetical protein [Paenarthrobacter sp. DKR-5]MBT1004002.1 hypothetical protein [Paenarthrobacter sp. DKR-5]
MHPSAKTGLAGTALVLALALTGCGAAATTNAAPAATSHTAGTNPQDVAPGRYPNPITNTSTRPGLSVTNAIVENNVQPGTQTPVNDHLELQARNDTAKPMSGLQIFYTLTDTATGAKESYSRDLTGLTIAPHTTSTIHFDNGTRPGHYGINTNGMYYKSTDKIDFTIELSAPGYKPVNLTVSKAAGGAEKKD